MKCNELGRSMVEMLGVLAIIGVLSVGAIAGYSKAMLKYKLNKQADQITFIMDNLLIHADEFSRDRGNISTDPGKFMSLIKKMNIIPDEMIRTDNDVSIYDALGNQTKVEYVKEQVGTYFSMNIVVSKRDIDVCFNIAKLMQQRSASLWHFSFLLDGGTILATDGDEYCTDNRDCLKDLKLTDMQEYCRTCQQSGYCRIGFSWGFVRAG